MISEQKIVNAVKKFILGAVKTKTSQTLSIEVDDDLFYFNIENNNLLFSLNRQAFSFLNIINHKSFRQVLKSVANSVPDHKKSEYRTEYQKLIRVANRYFRENIVKSSGFLEFPSRKYDLEHNLREYEDKPVYDLVSVFYKRANNQIYVGNLGRIYLGDAYQTYDELKLANWEIYGGINGILVHETGFSIITKLNAVRNIENNSVITLLETELPSDVEILFAVPRFTPINNPNVAVNYLNLEFDRGIITVSRADSTYLNVSTIGMIYRSLKKDESDNDNDELILPVGQISFHTSFFKDEIQNVFDAFQLHFKDYAIEENFSFRFQFSDEYFAFDFKITQNKNTFIIDYNSVIGNGSFIFLAREFTKSRCIDFLYQDLQQKGKLHFQDNCGVRSKNSDHVYIFNNLTNFLFLEGIGFLHPNSLYITVQYLENRIIYSFYLIADDSPVNMKNLKRLYYHGMGGLEISDIHLDKFVIPSSDDLNTGINLQPLQSSKIQENMTYTDDSLKQGFYLNASFENVDERKKEIKLLSNSVPKDYNQDVLFHIFENRVDNISYLSENGENILYVQIDDETWFVLSRVSSEAGYYLVNLDQKPLLPVNLPEKWW